MEFQAGIPNVLRVSLGYVLTACILEKEAHDFLTSTEKWVQLRLIKFLKSL
jgi:hypothetical protein